MNEEAMRKHYEKTPKETLIKILVASRKEVEKLQNRNKERKQEIEKLKEENNRLNNIINELEKRCNEMLKLYDTFNDEQRFNNWKEYKVYETILDWIEELKGSEKE